MTSHPLHVSFVTVVEALLATIFYNKILLELFSNLFGKVNSQGIVLISFCRSPYTYICVAVFFLYC